MKKIRKKENNIVLLETKNKPEYRFKTFIKMDKLYHWLKKTQMSEHLIDVFHWLNRFT